MHIVFDIDALLDPAVGAAPVTIPYASWGDQNEETSTTALLRTFMDANPDITATGLRFGSNMDFNDRITMLAAAGTLPDVSTFYEPNVLTRGMNGQFVDLTDFYKKANPRNRASRPCAAMPMPATSSACSSGSPG